MRRPLLAPPWYRVLCPMGPESPRPGTRGTSQDRSTHLRRRLGAERLLVQIQSPRFTKGLQNGRICGGGCGAARPNGSHRGSIVVAGGQAFVPSWGSSVAARPAGSLGLVIPEGVNEVIDLVE